jgi:glycosyltransferase involved in cell wall biosynthesis
LTISHLITVIIPVYNGEAFLSEAIQSVVDQVFSQWELLVIDDGSTDNSREIAAAYATRDSRIRVLQHPGGQNKGVSASRNLGIRQAKGEWIALLDADDVWLPTKLERQAKVIQSNDNLALIYCRAERKFEHYTGDVKSVLYGKGKPGLLTDPFIKTLRGFETPTSGVVFNKAVFNKTGGFDESLAYSEDTLLFHKLLSLGNLYFVDEVLLQARYHDNSVKQTTVKPVVIQARLTVYLKLLDFVNDAEYKKRVSYHAATTGMERPWRFFVKNPVRYYAVWADSIKKVWKNRQIRFLHKTASLFLPFRMFLHYLLRKAGWRRQGK